MMEYIKKKFGAIQLELELDRLIKAYNKMRGNYLIVYAAAMGKDIPDLGLNMNRLPYDFRSPQKCQLQKP
jgi:hypothetical protein